PPLGGEGMPPPDGPDGPDCPDWPEEFVGEGIWQALIKNTIASAAIRLSTEGWPVGLFNWSISLGPCQSFHFIRPILADLFNRSI
ncbi:hypothetical protein OAA89_00575, partial [bacterium]|nr:hypothetical protein [bacterium]